MAGFFGLFNYDKPGKGVSKNEPEKPRFSLFFELFIRKFWQLVKLNLLYLAFCLPIVTIGPATAGFMYVLRNLSMQQPVFMFSDFWEALRDNWKQSFGYSLLLLLAAFVLSFSLRFYMANLQSNWLVYIPVALCLLMAMVVLFSSFYVYLMIVTLDLPFRAILKNAAILAILCLKTNFLTFLFCGLLVVASMIFPVIGMLFFVLIGFALLGFIVSFNSYPGILKYAVSPVQQQAEEEQQGLFSDEMVGREEL